MVQHRPTLTMADQQKVVYDVSNGAIFNDLGRPLPNFKVTPFFDAEYLRNGKKYRHSFNEILIGTYSTVLFRMTLSDFGRLSKIFNGTKHCTVSLRQLSFLFFVDTVVLTLTFIP